MCGTLGEELGWHYGFTRRRRRDDDRACDLSLRVARSAAGRAAQGDGLGLEKQPLDRSEWRGILALLALFVPTTLFWATYEQQGNTIALWADDYTDRTIDLLIWRGEIPVTWFQAFNPFMIFAFTPFIIALWTWQARRGARSPRASPRWRSAASASRSPT